MISKDIVLNTLYPIEKILNLKDKKKNIKCPNIIDHPSDKKPSSHIYENHVYCFTCARRYYVIDIIKFNNLDKNELLKEILQQYTKEEIEELCKDIKVEKKEIKKVKNEDFLEFTKRFFKS
jgi:hypothetical protein